MTCTSNLKKIVYSIGIVGITVAFAALFVLEMIAITPISFASPVTNTVVASVNVPSACAISLNPNSINFGIVVPSQSTPVSTSVTDTNGGNTNTIIFVSAGNWISTTNAMIQFGTPAAEDTAYGATSIPLYSSGNVLSSTASPTTINIAANSANSVYFGVSVPSGQTANVYSQNILMENSC